jgi:5-bromo-4-chloroindolyl phosphate hydrolysis protein
MPVRKNYRNVRLSERRILVTEPKRALSRFLRNLRSGDAGRIHHAPDAFAFDGIHGGAQG